MQMESDNNSFRQVERQIKQYAKLNSCNLSKTMRNKRKKMLNDAELFNWSDVIDVKQNRNIKKISNKLVMSEKLNMSENCQIYQVDGLPDGFFIISDALTFSEQLIWAWKATQEYACVEHTNISNLLKVACVEHTNVSNLQEVEKASNEIDDQLLDVNQTSNQNDATLTTLTTCQENYWQISISKNDNFESFYKLRWSCLGYHYDWTDRMYRKNLKSAFPEDLSQLTQSIARAVGSDLLPEAAIVNFYPMGTNMGGHLDDAEHAMDKPIVSISIGCSAIFLLGGRQKSIKPMPILLRSGDAIVMSKESRYCYHGVPFILPSNFDPPDEFYHNEINPFQQLLNDSTNQKILTEFAEIINSKSVCKANVADLQYLLRYLINGRINMNIRQVTIPDAPWTDKNGTGSMQYSIASQKENENIKLII